MEGWIVGRTDGVATDRSGERGDLRLLPIRPRPRGERRSLRTFVSFAGAREAREGGIDAVEGWNGTRVEGSGGVERAGGGTAARARRARSRTQRATDGRTDARVREKKPARGGETLGRAIARSRGRERDNPEEKVATRADAHLGRGRREDARVRERLRLRGGTLQEGVVVLERGIDRDGALAVRARRRVRPRERLRARAIDRSASDAAEGCESVRHDRRPRSDSVTASVGRARGVAPILAWFYRSSRVAARGSRAAGVIFSD